MMFFRTVLFLALVTIAFARPNPSSLKTVYSPNGSKSSIKSPSQKLAEKNNSPSVAAIVESPVSQGVSQTENLSVNSPQVAGQDSDAALQYSPDLAHQPTKVNPVIVKEGEGTSGLKASSLNEIQPIVAQSIVTPVVVQPVVAEAPAQAIPSTIQNEVVKPSTYSNVVSENVDPSAHVVSKDATAHYTHPKESIVVSVQPSAPSTPLQSVVHQPIVDQPAITNVVLEQKSIPVAHTSGQPIAYTSGQPVVSESVVQTVPENKPIVNEVPVVVVPEQQQSKPVVVQPTIVETPVVSLPVIQPVVHQPVVNQPIVHQPAITNVVLEQKSIPVAHTSGQPIVSTVVETAQPIVQPKDQTVVKPIEQAVPVVNQEVPKESVSSPVVVPIEVVHNPVVSVDQTVVKPIEQVKPIESAPIPAVVVESVPASV